MRKIGFSPAVSHLAGRISLLKTDFAELIELGCTAAEIPALGIDAVIGAKLVSFQGGPASEDDKSIRPAVFCSCAKQRRGFVIRSLGVRTGTTANSEMSSCPERRPSCGWTIRFPYASYASCVEQSSAPVPEKSCGLKTVNHFPSNFLPRGQFSYFYFNSTHSLGDTIAK